MATKVSVAIRHVIDRLPVARRLGTRILPSAIVRSLTGRLMAARPDRVFLEEDIFPALRAQAFERILFVGSQSYTTHYGQYFERSTTEFWTTDIDPEAEMWGEPGRHITCDIQEIDRLLPAQSIDVVFLKGVLGHGLNERAEKKRAAKAIHHVLRRKGALVVGWNSQDPANDPNTIPGMTKLFAHTNLWGFAARTRVSRSTQVYDFYSKIDAMDWCG